MLIVFERKDLSEGFDRGMGAADFTHLKPYAQRVVIEADLSSLTLSYQATLDRRQPESIWKLPIDWSELHHGIMLDHDTNEWVRKQMESWLSTWEFGDDEMEQEYPTELAAVCSKMRKWEKPLNRDELELLLFHLCQKFNDGEE